MELLLDYRFKAATVANSDGSFPVRLAGVANTADIVESRIGRLEGAMDLGASGVGVADLEGLALDLSRFCLRVVVQATAPVLARQNIVESSRFPFALFFVQAADPSKVQAVASVRASAHGWHAATTQFVSKPLDPGVWYTIELAYDADTVALFVDGVIASVQAFPDGRITPLPGRELFIGAWVDGRRDHFNNGKIAALQLYTGIPAEIEAPLDERRIHPEWFISQKRAAVIALVGAPTGGVTLDASIGAYVQPHERGLIMYHDSLGAAFEMHGAIHAYYASAARKAELGYLTSDEGPASVQRGGRKNTFSKGAIYWSPATGAIPVIDRIFLGYENIDGVDLIGFPTRPAVAVAGGFEQEFQAGRMYYKNGMQMGLEVHGAILAKYLQLGGVARWGFPVTNEMTVTKNGQDIGRLSRFEGCTLYWSPATGAFETHGDLRDHYESLAGPAGDLGFPTSDEFDIPGEAGPGRYNTFQRGALCWYGNRNSIIHVRPFRIFIDRIETRESEGFGMGQNDLYFREIRVTQAGSALFAQRYPTSGDFSGKNNVNFDFTLPPTIWPGAGPVTLRMDIWESDPGDDDHMGTYTKVLDAANAWGLRESQGVFNTGAFSKVRALFWSVKPVVNVASLSETEKFWGKDNESTAVISYQKYASAFRDVDSESEWWDVSDWIEKAYYELFVDTLASTGNCFGMSLEAIYARMDLSRFSLPLNRFTTWPLLEPEMNVKHCYQAGASAIWWFVGQFLGGNTHDPKDVFRASRDAFQRGRHPVLCIAQNYDFSGSPHCILPVGWNDSVRPWRMDICDPNLPNALKQLTVDPDANTYKYVGSSTYEGGAWSGGRLHYMPFDVLCHRPRLPVWDLIQLLLSGVIIFVGGDATSQSIADHEGNDIDAFGERTKRRLQAGETIDDCFVPYKGSNGRGALASDMLLQMDLPGRAIVRPGITIRQPLVRIGDLLNARVMHPTAVDLAMQPGLRDAISERDPARVMADPEAYVRLTEETRTALRTALTARKAGDFVHNIAGQRDGSLRYLMKRGFNVLELNGPIGNAERNEVRAKDIGTSRWAVDVKAARDKRLRMTFESKLGARRDRIRMIVEGIPATAAKALQINPRPGLGGVDLMVDGGRVELPATFAVTIDGREVQRRFTVGVEGGARLQLTNLLSEGTLRTSRIERLFGPASGGKLLKTQ